MVQLSLQQVDFIAGYFSGVCGNLVSHPLDTVKVRMQSGQASSTKFFPVAKEIFINEGATGFYKGILSPVVGRAPISAIMWTSQGFAKRSFEKMFGEKEHPHLKQFLSGAFAGLQFQANVQVARAIPTTAVGIVTFEMARDYMLKFNKSKQSNQE
ncbi:hypothetical protein FGO68_gene1898 [Halteria grandinella]|uniref:Mitochondrial carrier protein n=1 Tax=Halteria grandinella TaxID=5974 RepID=A0A8J8SZG7_HALGN|nr:hypothetical protein FGO68_gene1898 [Halteria grandinella]